MNNKKIFDYLVVAIAMTTFSLQSACENSVSNTNIVSTEVYSLNVTKNKGASIEITINNKNNKSSFSTKDNKNGSASSNIGTVRSYKIYLVRSSSSVYPSGGDPIKDSISEMTVNVGASPTHKIKLNNVPPSTYSLGTGEYYHIAIRAFSGANATGNDLIKNNNGSSTPWSGVSYSTPQIAVSTGTGIQVVHKTFQVSSSSSLDLSINLAGEVGAEIDTKVDVSLGSSSVLTPSSTFKSNVRVFTIAGVPLQSSVMRTNAYLLTPDKMARDSLGRMYFTDRGLHSILRVNLDDTISIILGDGTFSLSAKYGDGGLATDAKTKDPSNIFIDASNNIYFTDIIDHVVRKIDSSTGIITTVAGTGVSGFSGDGGPATDAKLNGIEDVVVDSIGNIYIADKFNNRIRKVDLSGKISTFVGASTYCDSGPCGDGEHYSSSNVKIGYSIESLAIDSSDNIYFLDKTGGRLRKIDAITGIVSTISGPTVLPLSAGPPARYTCLGGPTTLCGDGGPATNATFTDPDDVFIASDGAIYITDSGANKIRKIDPITGIINTVVGNGNSGKQAFGGNPMVAPIRTFDASLLKPSGGASIVDSNGNIYIADKYNFRIAVASKLGQIDASMDSYVDNFFTNNRGDGKPATQAVLTYPSSMAKSRDGFLYFSDRKNFTIRRINESTGVVSRYSGANGSSGFAGDGTAYSSTSVRFNEAHHILLDNIGNMFITDRKNHRIRKITKSTGIIKTIAGTSTNCSSTILPCGDGGPASLANFNLPTYLAFDKLGNLFISDRDDHAIRKIDAVTGIITTIAGTLTVPCPSPTDACGDGGPATSAKLNQPYSIKIDSSGNLIIADRTNRRIRKVDLSLPTPIITSIVGTGALCSFGNTCGDGGPATDATLNEPVAAEVDSAGNIYILDKKAFKIRRIDKNGIISTILGDGYDGIGLNGDLAKNVRLNESYGLFIDQDDNIYFADAGNNLIRVIK